MIRVVAKTKLRAQAIAKLKNTIDENFIKKVNDEVVAEAKRLIAAGSSPVESYEGRGRFKKYKDEKKYPGKGQNRLKPARPVNLSLTGEMLRFYKAMKINGIRFSIGILPFAPKEVKDRAIANNEGTMSGGEVAIAARRFIPLKGETFTVSVMRKLKNLYAARIKALLSK